MFVVSRQALDGPQVNPDQLEVTLRVLQLLAGFPEAPDGLHILLDEGLADLISIFSTQSIVKVCRQSCGTRERSFPAEINAALLLLCVDWSSVRRLLVRLPDRFGATGAGRAGRHDTEALRRCLGDCTREWHLWNTCQSSIAFA